MRNAIKGMLVGTLFVTGLSLGLSTSSATATDECIARCFRGTLYVCCGNQCYIGGDC